MLKHRITLTGITKTFISDARPLTVLRGIDATFSSHTTYAIMGISGSGKSTLLHLIAGFDVPTSGAAFFNDEPLSLFSEQKKQWYAQQIIGFLFQKPYLIKELTVIENIMLPAQVMGIPDAIAHTRAHELLEVIGLTAYTSCKPGVLSGGQQQKVSLARALCNKPHFLLADEPTASLDAASRNNILELINYGVQAWGMGVIVCTHDIAVAHAMNHIIQLRDGIIVA